MIDDVETLLTEPLDGVGLRAVTSLGRVVTG